MPDETTMTVEGVQVDPLTGEPTSPPVDEPPRVIETYLVVDDQDQPVHAVQWDGVAEFHPGDGLRLERAEDWKGDPYTGPPEDADHRQRRTRLDRLVASRDQAEADEDRRAKDEEKLTKLTADLTTATTVAALRAIVSDVLTLLDRANTREKRALRARRRVIGLQIDVMDDADTGDDQ